MASKGFINPSSRKFFDRYLTHGEEKKLYAAVKRVGDVYAQRDFAWMMLIRQTGIRVGALSQLTRHDACQALATGYLDLKPEIMKKNQGLRIHLNTTDKQGRVSAQTALQRLLALHAQMHGGDDPDSPLILSRNNKAMSIRSYQSRMANWCKEAGLNVPATPHWLRHTCAKRLLSNSTSTSEAGKLQIISDRLGHSNPRSTAFYTLPDKATYMQCIEESS